jgi:hypothetical protein
LGIPLSRKIAELIYEKWYIKKSLNLRIKKSILNRCERNMKLSEWKQSGNYFAFREEIKN